MENRLEIIKELNHRIEIEKWLRAIGGRTFPGESSSEEIYLRPVIYKPRIMNIKRRKIGLYNVKLFDDISPQVKELADGFKRTHADCESIEMLAYKGADFDIVTRIAKQLINPEWDSINEVSDVLEATALFLFQNHRGELNTIDVLRRNQGYSGKELYFSPYSPDLRHTLEEGLGTIHHKISPGIGKAHLDLLASWHERSPCIVCGTFHDKRTLYRGVGLRIDISNTYALCKNCRLIREDRDFDLPLLRLYKRGIIFREDYFRFMFYLSYPKWRCEGKTFICDQYLAMKIIYYLSKVKIRSLGYKTDYPPRVHDTSGMVERNPTAIKDLFYNLKLSAFSPFIQRCFADFIASEDSVGINTMMMMRGLKDMCVCGSIDLLVLRYLVDIDRISFVLSNIVSKMSYKFTDDEFIDSLLDGMSVPGDDFVSFRGKKFFMDMVMKKGCIELNNHVELSKLGKRLDLAKFSPYGNILYVKEGSHSLPRNNNNFPYYVV